MQSRNVVAAGVSVATLGLLFGASAAQAATLDPVIRGVASFESVLVAADNNNNNNNNQKDISLAAKPAELADLASSLT